MAMMLYHVIGDPEPVMVSSDVRDGYKDDQSSPTAWLKRSVNFDKASVQPILFMSKCLSGQNGDISQQSLRWRDYAGQSRKTSHMIQAALKVYIFTDHAAVMAVSRQRRLTTTESLESLNLRLAKASVYLQQFDLDIRYRPGKLHAVLLEIHSQPLRRAHCR